jgi:hypothetical protein
VLGMHILPAAKHGRAAHKAAAEFDQLLIKANRIGVRHALDRAVAAGQSSELTREDIVEEVCVPSGNMAF